MRRYAQSELFAFLAHYIFAWNIIVDCIVELLDSSKTPNDDQIKVHSSVSILYHSNNYII